MTKTYHDVELTPQERDLIALMTAELALMLPQITTRGMQVHITELVKRIVFEREQEVNGNG